MSAPWHSGMQDFQSPQHFLYDAHSPDPPFGIETAIRQHYDAQHDFEKAKEKFDEAKKKMEECEKKVQQAEEMLSYLKRGWMP